MIEWNGPKWLFDIDSLTQSMNYVPVAACTITNEYADASYFDSLSKDVGNDEPKYAANDIRQVEDGPHNESDDKDKSVDDNSPKEDNAARQHINTASSKVNIGHFEFNTVDPLVNTASSYDPHSLKDMIKVGASHTLEATHVEFFSDEDEPEVNLGNIPNSYTTRRMTRSTSAQGFLSAVYEEKTHDTLNTCLYEEIMQFKLQQVWILVDLPNGKRAIGTKWVFRNKKDERGIVIRNKERGKIDQTLFIKKQKGDSLLVQVYVDDIIFGSTNKELCTAFEKLMKDKFQMSSMGELTFFLGLQVKQKEDGIFISQDKYVAEILKKFNYTDVKSASTPVDLEKPLVKDGDADDVDVHLYRSMIGSLMYLTASRPDIIYLKGKPTLGLWYSRDSPFELVAYTDSDYAGATQDRKSTTRAEYVAAASCYGQVLWIQNQLLDYGYNFMNTMIHIDNNSTICIIENPVQHSKTKHIEIRHHFIRDCNAKKLIQMVKINTDHNVADLLTKGFDAGRFQYLVSSIGMLV
ncbi:putative ribonuclease H-like domain-containing protein [Tanacetum coccineum]